MDIESSEKAFLVQLSKGCIRGVETSRGVEYHSYRVVTKYFVTPNYVSYYPQKILKLDDENGFNDLIKFIQSSCFINEMLKRCLSDCQKIFISGKNLEDDEFILKAKMGELTQNTVYSRRVPSLRSKRISRMAGAVVAERPQLFTGPKEMWPLDPFEEATRRIDDMDLEPDELVDQDGDEIDLDNFVMDGEIPGLRLVKKRVHNPIPTFKNVRVFRSQGKYSPILVIEPKHVQEEILLMNLGVDKAIYPEEELAKELMSRFSSCREIEDESGGVAKLYRYQYKFSDRPFRLRMPDDKLSLLLSLKREGDVLVVKQGVVAHSYSTGLDRLKEKIRHSHLDIEKFSFSRRIKITKGWYRIFQYFEEGRSVIKLSDWIDPMNSVSLLVRSMSRTTNQYIDIGSGVLYPGDKTTNFDSSFSISKEVTLEIKRNYFWGDFVERQRLKVINGICKVKRRDFILNHKLVTFKQILEKTNTLS